MHIKCQHCGSEEGFYIKTRYWTNTDEIFNADGEGQFSATADSMLSKRGKNVYCIDCNKVICKVEEIEDELDV